MKNKYVHYGLYLLIFAVVSLPVIYGSVFSDAGMVKGLLLPVIQLGTLVLSLLCFATIFAGDTTGIAAPVGVLLYMTCPYRMFACYDPVNLSAAVFWMLLPVYTWAMLRAGKEKNRRKELLIAGIALGEIAYADTVYFVILVGITLVVVIGWKRFWGLIPLGAGCVLALPRLYQLACFLFTDADLGWKISIQSIMEKGYRLGEYFHSYVYREGRPGMGLAIIIGILSLLWMKFVPGMGTENRLCKVAGILSIIMLILSFYRFPWDILQRLGSWSLKLVSLINTPAIFAGLGFACLTVPAAWGVTSIFKSENKVIAYGISGTVVILAVGLCIYQGMGLC